MWNFLKPEPHKPLLPEKEIDPTYKRLRWQVFIGIFIGYAGYYLVRKNFALAMPYLLSLIHIFPVIKNFPVPLDPSHARLSYLSPRSSSDDA